MGVEHLLGPDSGTAGARVVAELKSGRWSRVTMVVAFARMSGVRQFEARLRDFITAGGRVDLTIGVDVRGTTYEAAWYLMNAVSARGRLLLASSEPGATFHPKVFVMSDAPSGDANARRALRGASDALTIVGSSNLTGGGLYGNDEASSVWEPDLTEAADRQAWHDLIGQLSPWLAASSPVIVGSATPSRLLAMARSGRLPQELTLPGSRPKSAATVAGTVSTRKRVRKRAPRPPALVGTAPPALQPPAQVSPPGLSVLIARMIFGASRRWPQWELNADVLSTFFGVTTAGSVINREGVKRSGARLAVEPTPLVIGTNRNRRLEFPEPDGRPDPSPKPAFLVAVDRRPQAFRYAVLLPGDSEYSAIEALNRSRVPVGQYVETTRRIVVPYADLVAVWPGCPL